MNDYNLPIDNVEERPDVVLIIDDTPANLELLANNLRDHGYKIAIAGNSEVAIDRAKRILPDIILLDIMMPGVDGIETCRRLKSIKETKDIPVIFMTALTDIEHKKEGFKVGGVDYITKPIQYEELIARVSTHLEIRRYRENLEKQVELRTQKLNEEIAERKKTADELRLTLEKLEESSREVIRSQRELFNAKLNKAQAELKSLKSQINPHFLYNTLESIKMMAVIKDENDLADAITQLGDLFRYSIKGDDNFVTIKDEVDLAESYLSLLKLRYQEKLQYTFKIDKGHYKKKTVKFILQPIIENAIYHGVVSKQGTGQITISLLDRDGDLVFTVEDDGIGMEESALEALKKRILRTEEDSSDSIGLTNVNKRIKLLCGPEYGIEISGQENQGFKVSIVFPDKL